MTEINIDPEMLETAPDETKFEQAAPAAHGADPVGVDVGSYHIVVCHRQGGQLITRSQLNAFFELPHRKFTQGILDKNRISYVHDNGSLVIIGDEAEKFALIMNAETRRPMLDGLINPKEPKALWAVRKIAEHLIGPPESLGETLCLALPAVAPGLEPRSVYQEAVLKDLFMSMGYRVRLVNEGHATVLACLEESQLNGIGISLGAGMCNGCLSYLSVPVLTFGYHRGGDYIDQATAAVTEMSPSEIRLAKETELDLSRSPGNRVENALQIFHDELIRGILNRLQEAIEASTNLPRIHQSMPLVLGGGTVMPRGFLERFRKIFSEFSFSIPISEVMLAAEPLTATARGAYLAAIAEEMPALP